MGVSGVSLREITDQNRAAVVALRIAASQEAYVSSVADSLEEARETPEGNPWYRAIYADDQPVGSSCSAGTSFQTHRESSDRGSFGSC
jgi:hypothetical protein